MNVIQNPSPLPPDPVAGPAGSPLPPDPVAWGAGSPLPGRPRPAGWPLG
jgi:hypothetical protein